MSMEGRLDTANLLEIVRLLHDEARDGKLSLRNDNKIGFVYLKKGEMVSAKLGGTVGEEAIFQMTLWDRGEYRFEAEPVTEPNTISTGHHNIMLEAARRFSEWKTISKQIPSMEMVPEFVPQPHSETPQISLSTNEWVLLSKVDGQRDIRTISEGSRFGLFETCKIFYGLVSSGLLRIRNTSEDFSSSLGEPTHIESSPENTARLSTVAEKFLKIGEKYLGSFATSIIEKSLRKARVNLDDEDVDRQSTNMKRSVDYIQRASSTILGPDLAAQMAVELEEELTRVVS